MCEYGWILMYQADRILTRQKFGLISYSGKLSVPKLICMKCVRPKMCFGKNIGSFNKGVDVTSYILAAFLLFHISKGFQKLQYAFKRDNYLCRKLYRTAGLVTWFKCSQNSILSFRTYLLSKLATRNPKYIFAVVPFLLFHTVVVFS